MCPALWPRPMAPGRGSASQKPKLWSKGSSGGGARFDVPRRESKTAVRLELVRYLGEGMGEGATAEVLAWTALEAAPRDGPRAEGVCGGRGGCCTGREHQPRLRRRSGSTTVNKMEAKAKRIARGMR